MLSFRVGDTILLVHSIKALHSILAEYLYFHYFLKLTLKSNGISLCYMP